MPIIIGSSKNELFEDGVLQFTGIPNSLLGENAFQTLIRQTFIVENLHFPLIPMQAMWAGLLLSMRAPRTLEHAQCAESALRINYEGLRENLLGSLFEVL